MFFISSRPAHYCFCNAIRKTHFLTNIISDPLSDGSAGLCQVFGVHPPLYRLLLHQRSRHPGGGLGYSLVGHVIIYSHIRVEQWFLFFVWLIIMQNTHDWWTLWRTMYTMYIMYTMYTIYTRYNIHNIHNIQCIQCIHTIPRYIIHLVRGMLLFISLALIGMGFAFVKHVLSANEKLVLMTVVPLQVIN